MQTNTAKIAVNNNRQKKTTLHLRITKQVHQQKAREKKQNHEDK